MHKLCGMGVLGHFVEIHNPYHILNVGNASHQSINHSFKEQNWTSWVCCSAVLFQKLLLELGY